MGILSRIGIRFVLAERFTCPAQLYWAGIYWQTSPVKCFVKKGYDSRMLSMDVSLGECGDA